MTKSRGCPGDHLEDLVAKSGRRAGTVVFEDEDGGADFPITVSSSSTAAAIHRAASLWSSDTETAALHDRQAGPYAEVISQERDGGRPRVGPGPCRVPLSPHPGSKGRSSW